MMTREEPDQRHLPQIILGEGDPASRRSTQMFILGEGFSVRSYASAKSVLTDPGARSASWLIIDCQMPDINGIDVFVLLRRDGWTGNGILITAFSSPELTKRAEHAGFTMVLEKPLRYRALADLLRISLR